MCKQESDVINFISFTAPCLKMDQRRRQERPDRLRLKSTNFESEGRPTKGPRSDGTSEIGKATVETNQETKSTKFTTAGTLATQSSDRPYRCEDADKEDKIACETESAITPEVHGDDDEDTNAQYGYIVIGINLLDLQEGSLSSPVQVLRTQGMNEDKVGDQASDLKGLCR